MKITSILSFILALALAAGCGGGGTVVMEEDQKDAGTDAILFDLGQEDTAQPDTTPEGCNTAADCTGKGLPGPCQEIACVDKVCQVIDSTNGKICDDGDKCTDNDQCLQGQCKGQPKACSDGSICTDDQCNPETGECQFVNNTQPCDDGNKCTKDDACKDGACVGGETICDPCTGDADCVKYDDGNLCNGLVKCINQECVADPTSAVDCSNMPEVACKSVSCDPQDGQCKYKNLENGKPCSDGNACTKDETCTAGTCLGTTVNCNDGNPCTTDSCDPATGCTKTSAPDGTSCNDGDLCTKDDGCKQGVCTGEPLPDCSGCTSDVECQQFEDGNLCNGLVKCISGQCKNDPTSIVMCPGTDNPCKTNACNPSTGECENKLALNGTACNDANACTKDDYCSAGACVGLPVACNDNNACTQDSCDPATGCVNAPKEGNCGDGDPCTINDKCVNGACVGDPDPTCNCNTDEDCVDDGDLCNGVMSCINKRCVVKEGSVVDCADVPTTSCQTVACIPETGACEVKAAADATTCDDANACTKNDTCVGGLCKGQNIVCDDGNICTSDGCSSAIGCVYTYNNNSCNDNDYCTLDDICVQGVCKGQPNPECTCTVDADCAERDDEDLCNGVYRCIGYKCLIDPDSIVTCDTSSDTQCQRTECVPATGLCEKINAPDDRLCDDSNACTLTDLCQQGLCTGTGAPDCNDGNQCTTDSCDPVVGCIAANFDGACDDNDPCTEGDFCLEGVCQPGGTQLCGVCQPDWTLVCGGTDRWDNSWTGSTDVIESYPCSIFTYSAPEYTYSFTAEYDATVTVTLSEEEADTDVMILESSGTGCQPTACIAFDYSTASFQAEAGKTYFFVVDGFEGGALPGTGLFTITVGCVPLTEQNCSDGIDDDQDGLVDCEDSEDCLPGSEACPFDQCVPDWTLYCDSSDSWSTLNPGATDLLDNYGCNFFDYPGAEYTYIFQAEATGPVTFTLSDESADLDIMVLSEASDGSCLASECMDWGLNDITIDAVAGNTYFIVIDGYNGEEGSYTIKVTCGG